MLARELKAPLLFLSLIVTISADGEEGTARKQYLKWLSGVEDIYSSTLVPVPVIYQQGQESNRRTNHGDSLLQKLDERPAKDLTSNARTLQNTCTADIPEWKIFYRVHNESGRCYIPGKGVNPCPLNMDFYVIPGDDEYGICDCKSNTGKYTRPYVYSSFAKHCYTLYDRGSCKVDEWLTLDSKTGVTKCTQRTCPQTEVNAKPWVTFNSTCVQLLTPGFCGAEGEVMYYGLNEIEPQCRAHLPNRSKKVFNDLLTLPCQPGHFAYGTQFCPSEK